MKTFKYILLILLVVILVVPNKGQMPVKGATSNDYHSESFWHGNWGESVVHKGIDIFADRGIEIWSTVNGIVVSASVNDMGGNNVRILTPNLRLHYYAHLENINVEKFQIVYPETIIGTVGNTGNASTSPPHLHYDVITFIPQLWKFNLKCKQPFKRMFYIDPVKYL